MTATVVILVPVLHRPGNVAPLLESIAATTVDYRVLFIASDDDRPQIEALEAAGADFLLSGQSADRGQYAAKINLAYRETGEPLLFLAADDLAFHTGWFEAAVAKLGPGVGVVGTNDLCNPRVMSGEHSTHSLVTREYVDEFGTIDEPGQVLHEGYWHEFCDDEFVGTAKFRHAFTFACDSIVEHLHPMAGKGGVEVRGDGLYAMQRHRMYTSRPLYKQRRHLWGE